MGAGKTTVGRRLARALGWRFEDFDRAIEIRVGRSVPEIFRERGEAGFRALERQIAEALLRERQVVLASGGGWAAGPGRLDSIPPGTETFWLRVSPTEALDRVRGDAPGRPLLDRVDAEDEASRLVEERAPYYAIAHWVVDTDRRSVEDVTAGILAILASKYPEVSTAESE